MSATEAREIPASEYMLFLATVPHSVFHRLPVLSIVAAVYGFEVIPLGFYQDDQLFAVSPLIRRRWGPFSLWGAPLRKCMVPPCTPCCAPAGEANRTLAALQAWARRKKIQYLQITLPPAAGTAGVLSDRAENLDNLELDLTPPLSSLWRGLSQQRAEVRKAMRAGVRVHWCHDDRILQWQSLMLRDTYGRQGHGVQPNYPPQLYQELVNRKETIGLRILCAKHKGQTIAALWLFVDAERCYYWDAVSLAAARSLSANHLLVWCLIRWARGRGYKILDFVGTSTGGRGGSRPGIGRFKQSMGARPVNYTLVYWYSTWMGALLRVYRFFQSVKTRLRVWEASRA